MHVVIIGVARGGAQHKCKVGIDHLQLHNLKLCHSGVRHVGVQRIATGIWQSKKKCTTLLLQRCCDSLHDKQTGGGGGGGGLLFLIRRLYSMNTRQAWDTCNHSKE